MADYAPVDLTAENLVSFELNGEKVQAPAGTMLVDACHALGVEVPIFCYEPRIGPPVGACRMCLVEVEGMRGLQTACSTPVQPDMVVRTTSELATQGQESVLELLLANHPLDCPVCDKGGECPLQDRTFRFGPGKSRFHESKRHFLKPVELSSRIALDRERCISCFRCVRFSQEVAQDGQLTMQERGGRSEIATFSGDAYEARFTGNIIDVCPVGALTSIPYRFVARPWDVTNTPSVCGLCPVGCNTELTLREGVVRRVSGRDEPNYAVEEGWLCDVGRWAYDSADHTGRLHRAVVRDANGARETNMADALSAATLVLQRADGPVGILLGPAATVEEAAIALDLAGGALRGAVVARLGIPAGPLAPLRATRRAEMGDIDDAQTVIVVGGDPSLQQPVVELRLRKAALRRGARIVTVGSRRTGLADVAEHVDAAPGALHAAISDIAARIAASAEPVVLWDEAELAAEPAAADALATAIAANGAARQIELGQDPNGAGLRALGIPATGLRDALAAGRLGALITVHADPRSAPGRDAWDAALGDVPVVSVATHVDATTDRATVVLPSLTLWEQEGTLVSMTGRAQRVRRGADGPDGAAPGWEILIALGHYLGAPPAYRTPGAAFAAAAKAHPGLGGLTYDDMGTLGAPLPPPAADHLAGDAGESVAAGSAGLALVAVRDVHAGRAAQGSEALLAFHAPAAARVSAATAERARLTDGATARISSPHGEATLPVRVAPGLPDDAVFVALGTPGAAPESLLGPDRGPVRVELRP
ncbi:MAG: (2Fe-2S)-binding protein [Thermoleophilia bacterium]|nr:(2Fe-2S)-binding protein [Thermoleophilia bacterium]